MKKVYPSFVQKAVAIGVLMTVPSVNAFADCQSIFGNGEFRFLYNESNQQASGTISSCGENNCFKGHIDFGNRGKQRLEITYDGSTWWADWFDTSNKPLWLMGTCQGSIAKGTAGYKNRASDTYYITIQR